MSSGVSVDIPRSPLHFGHTNVSGISFTARIFAKSREVEQASNRASFKILTFVDSIKISFNFSGGIRSVFRLILSIPILAIGVGYYSALLIVSEIGCNMQIRWNQGLIYYRVRYSVLFEKGIRLLSEPRVMSEFHRKPWPVPANSAVRLVLLLIRLGTST